MQAKPRRLSDDAVRTYPLADGRGLWIECEVTHPPSMAGRIIDVLFDTDAVTKLLPEFRRSAIAARSKPEGVQ